MRPPLYLGPCAIFQGLCFAHGCGKLALGWLRPPLNFGLRPSINSQQHLPPAGLGALNQSAIRCLECEIEKIR